MLTLEECFRQLNETDESITKKKNSINLMEDNSENDYVPHGVDLINGEYDQNMENKMYWAEWGSRTFGSKHTRYKGYLITRRGSGYGSYKIYGVPENDTFDITSLSQAKDFINKLIAQKNIEKDKSLDTISDEITEEFDDIISEIKKYIKKAAKEDFQTGKGFDSDDHDYFIKIVKEDFPESESLAQSDLDMLWDYYWICFNIERERFNEF